MSVAYVIIALFIALWLSFVLWQAIKMLRKQIFIVEEAEGQPAPPRKAAPSSAGPGDWEPRYTPPGQAPSPLIQTAVPKEEWEPRHVAPTGQEPSAPEFRGTSVAEAREPPAPATPEAPVTRRPSVAGPGGVGPQGPFQRQPSREAARRVPPPSVRRPVRAKVPPQVPEARTTPSPRPDAARPRSGPAAPPQPSVRRDAQEPAAPAAPSARQVPPPPQPTPGKPAPPRTQPAPERPAPPSPAAPVGGEPPKTTPTPPKTGLLSRLRLSGRRKRQEVQGPPAAAKTATPAQSQVTPPRPPPSPVAKAKAPVEGKKGKRVFKLRRRKRPAPAPGKLAKPATPRDQQEAAPAHDIGVVKKKAPPAVSTQPPVAAERPLSPTRAERKEETKRGIDVRGMLRRQARKPPVAQPPERGATAPGATEPPAPAVPKRAAPPAPAPPAPKKRGLSKPGVPVRPKQPTAPVRKGSMGDGWHTTRDGGAPPATEPVQPAAIPLPSDAAFGERAPRDMWGVGKTTQAASRPTVATPPPSPAVGVPQRPTPVQQPVDRGRAEAPPPSRPAQRQPAPAPKAPDPGAPAVSTAPGAATARPAESTRVELYFEDGTKAHVEPDSALHREIVDAADHLLSAKPRRTLKNLFRRR